MKEALDQKLNWDDKIGPETQKQWKVYIWAEYKIPKKYKFHDGLGYIRKNHSRFMCFAMLVKMHKE